MHYMKSSTKPPGGKKSIVLVVSTSGYFGNTAVSGYVSSKHGIIGLLRSSQVAAKQNGVSITGIAPFFTPTNITSKVAERWKANGLESNTPEQMGMAIAQSSVEASSGSCTLVRFLPLPHADHRTNLVDLKGRWSIPQGDGIHSQGDHATVARRGSRGIFPGCI
jgi:NAD(P)-dependent dehydrogenase (short-subunit alcohol dehydrogenase family)